MNNDIEKKVQAARKLGLSTEEKREMQMSLLRFMNEHPEPTTPIRPAPSPFYFPRLYAGVMVAAVFVIYVGSAEAAQPGDAMYYFKTRVNEPVVRALAFTPELHAEVTQAVLERRLTEAVALGLNDSAEYDDWETMKTELERASVGAAESVQKFVEQGNLADAIGISSEQQATLTAHDAIFAELSEREGGEEIQKALEDVRRYNDSINEVANALSAELHAQPDLGAAAEKSLEAIAHSLEEATSTLEEIRDGGDEETAAELQQVIEDVMLIFSEGQEALDEDEHGDALLKFEEARKILNSSLIIIQMEEELHLDIDTATSSPEQLPTSSENLERRLL